MSYSTARYGRQSVSNDESFVSYVQNPRFDVSDSGTESYLGPDEETYPDHDEATYLDHDEATYSNYDEATYSDHDEATYSNYDEATYSDHDEATYSNYDEETDSHDSGQDDPRCYGKCPGKLAPDAISNKNYRCGNANFDYIKAYWPETIPRHFTWDGRYPVDERHALARVQNEIGTKLKDMPSRGHWVPFEDMCHERITPYIVTITYLDSNPLVTLSYALLCEPSGQLSVFGFKLCLAEQYDPTPVSRFYLFKAAGGQDGSTNTPGFLDFRTPPTLRIHEQLPMYRECDWWVPEHIACVDGFNFHFQPYEVAERSTPSSRETGHGHGVGQ